MFCKNKNKIKIISLSIQLSQIYLNHNKNNAWFINWDTFTSILFLSWYLYVGTYLVFCGCTIVQTNTIIFLLSKNVCTKRMTCVSIKSSIGGRHGLQTPNEAFFHRTPKLLSLGRQSGKTNFGAAFGVFTNDLSVPILVLWVPSMFSILFYKNLNLSIQIPNISLGLGF